jgi:hypothetical protein
MGAGGKADVTRLHISDCRTAAKDPLATKLRQSLKKLIPDDDPNDSFLDDIAKLAIIYSSEKPVVKLADFTQEQQEAGVHHFGAVDGMRIRVLPVLGTMPAIMGQSLAAMALTEIGGKPFQPVPGERLGRNVRNKMYQQLKRREDLITKKVLQQAGLTQLPNEEGCLVNDTWIGPLGIDGGDDVECLLEIWRNRCAITGARLGTVLQLARWDTQRPSTCDNLVLISVNALKKFDAPCGKDKIPPVVQKRIESRLQTCHLDKY